MKLKELIPPIILSLIKKYKRHKEYETYDLAFKDCSLKGYQNAELCNMIAVKTIHYAKELEKKPFYLNSTSVFLLSAINQYLSVSLKRTIKVLDYGGACGAHFYEIKRFIPQNILLTWYVVETAQMVESATNHGLGNDELRFVRSITDIDVQIDFIHSSCALHYVSDPYEQIKALIKTGANWIFFNRMMFNKNDRDFITIQKTLLSSNGPGPLPVGYSDRIISYPHTTLSFQKFNSSFSNNGFSNEWAFYETSGSYQIGKYLIEGKGLLYIKKLFNDQKKEIQ